MDNLLSPLFEELIVQVRQAVRDELAAANTAQLGSQNKKPVTQTELCKFLNVTAQTIIRWKKKGKIPFYTVGNAIRFDLDKVIKSLEQ